MTTLVFARQANLFFPKFALVTPLMSHSLLTTISAKREGRNARCNSTDPGLVQLKQA